MFQVFDIIHTLESACVGSAGAPWIYPGRATLNIFVAIP
jgi:hypothetical protein